MEDLSESGVRVKIGEGFKVPRDVRISIRGDLAVQAAANASVVWSETVGAGETRLSLNFVDVDADTHRKLVQLMFSPDDSWVEQSYPKDRVWRSFWYLITTFWRISALPASGQYEHR